MDLDWSDSGPLLLFIHDVILLGLALWPFQVTVQSPRRAGADVNSWDIDQEGERRAVGIPR